MNDPLLDLPRPAPLTRAEERALFAELRATTREKKDPRPILDRVYQQYINWSVFLVSRGCRWSLDPREILSIAAELLMRSAVKYNPRSGIRFCTYARHRIEGGGRTGLKGLATANAKRMSPDDRNSDPADIQYRAAIRQPDEAIDDCVERVDTRLKIETLREKLQTIDPLTRSFILLYYSGVTLRELGRRHNLSHERIRQLIQIAVRKLRTEFPVEPGVLEEGVDNRTPSRGTVRGGPGQRLPGGGSPASTTRGDNPTAPGDRAGNIHRRKKWHQHQPDVRSDRAGNIQEGV